MRSTIKIVTVIVTCVGMYTCTGENKSSKPEKPAAPPVIDTLAYIQRLEGTWISSDSNYKEVWRNGETFCGGGYSLTDSGEVLNEDLRIFRQNGNWYYGARVIDQNDGTEVRFKLTTVDSAGLVFENPLHDFPTHIDYAFNGSDQVVISVRDNHNGFKIEARKTD